MDFGDFLGGFAESLKGGIDNNLSDQREARRDRARMELEKEYAKEVVTRTERVGDMMVSYNKYGDKVGERPLTDEERRLSAAALTEAEATAGTAKFNLDTAPELFDMRRETHRDGLATNAAQRAASAESVASSRYRRSLDERNEARAASDAAYELHGLLSSIRNEGKASDQSQAEVLGMELEQAVETISDPEELRREIIRLKAAATRIAARARTIDSTRPNSGGGQGALLELLMNNRSLDEQDDGFRVVPGGR
jgi:hypothetical protein